MTYLFFAFPNRYWPLTYMPVHYWPGANLPGPVGPTTHEGGGLYVPRDETLILIMFAALRSRVN